MGQATDEPAIAGVTLLGATVGGAVLSLRPDDPHWFRMVGGALLGTFPAWLAVALDVPDLSRAFIAAPALVTVPLGAVMGQVLR